MKYNQSGQKLLLTTFFLILFTRISCQNFFTNPNYEITLAVEDVAASWAMLRVTLPDSGKINKFVLERNDSTISTIKCLDDDTLITDEGLSPETEYTYSVRFIKDGETQAESETVTIQTMSTTSHDFTWEIDTLGLYGSFLNDVWIVNENDIWAVGVIIVPDPDSSYNGTGSRQYNLAHWDGENWSLGQAYNTSWLYSIQYFAENNIWATSSGYPRHWDGNEWTLYQFHSMGIDASAGFASWSSSPSDIYFVGREGAIVHYDGTGFTKMEVLTDAPLVDVFGIDENHVWAVGRTNTINDEHPDGYESVLLYYDGKNWARKYECLPDYTSDRSDSSLSGYVNSVWVYRKKLFVSSKSGLWIENIENGAGNLEFGPDKRLRGYPFIIRGTDYNDIYAFTRWAEFMHYNGKTWDRNLTLDRFSVEGACVKDDIVVMVGDMHLQYAVIARGHHD